NNLLTGYGYYSVIDINKNNYLMRRHEYRYYFLSNLSINKNSRNSLHNLPRLSFGKSRNSSGVFINAKVG
ncbi:MAG: hypothetical protein ACTS8W_03580, partial [Arsenophonus sp. NC-PY1-MAG3]